MSEKVYKYTDLYTISLMVLSCIFLTRTIWEFLYRSVYLYTFFTQNIVLPPSEYYLTDRKFST